MRIFYLLLFSIPQRQRPVKGVSSSKKSVKCMRSVRKIPVLENKNEKGYISKEISTVVKINLAR